MKSSRPVFYGKRRRLIRRLQKIGDRRQSVQIFKPDIDENARLQRNRVAFAWHSSDTLQSREIVKSVARTEVSARKKATFLGDEVVDVCTKLANSQALIGRRHDTIIATPFEPCRASLR